MTHVLCSRHAKMRGKKITLKEYPVLLNSACTQYLVNEECAMSCGSFKFGVI